MKKNNFYKLLLFAAFFVLLNTGCNSTEAKFGIIFSAELDGNQDIYRMYGSNFGTIERLTFTSIAPEGSITPTKDGQKILFNVPSPGIERIQAEGLIPPATYAHSYLLDVKTKKIKELGDGLGLYPNYPQTWSKDNKEFILTEISSGKIYSVDIDGMSVQVSQIPHEHTGSKIDYLNYSYDGEQIAYEELQRYQAPPTPIVRSFIYDFNSKMVFPLMGDELTDCRNPKWSPTRKQVLLFCTPSKDNASEKPQVRFLNINLSQENNVVEVIAVYPACYNPAWSPDGYHVAMVCRDDEKNTGIFLSDFDGTNHKEILTNVPYYVPYLLWFPDGKQLVYSGAGNSTDKRHIYLTDIDGTNNHVITQEAANYTGLFVYPIEP